MQSNARSHVDRLCWDFALVFMRTRLWHCYVTGRLLFLGNDTNAPKLGEVKGVGYFWYWFLFNWAYQLADSTGNLGWRYYNNGVTCSVLTDTWWILSDSCFLNLSTEWFLPFHPFLVFFSFQRNVSSSPGTKRYSNFNPITYAYFSVVSGRLDTIGVEWHNFIIIGCQKYMGRGILY